jgi:integrase
VVIVKEIATERAVTCKSEPSDAVRAYVEAGIAPATRRASSPLVRATMRGVRREHGTAQRQAKPLLREDLFVILTAIEDRLKDLRDRALLLVGFAGGLRRAERVAIT